MWPKLLDMSRDDCKRLMRRMELEAYAGIISAFRAQGALTDEKRKMLNDLCNMLSISTERHRAEIRRAVNDEKFATVAELLSGSNTGGEWAIEGRRLVPLLPRLVPQTAFTIAANQAASLAQAHNLTLPPPAETTTKDVSTPTSSSSSNVKPASPNSGMVVLPSGLSIPIKSPSDLSDNENGVPPPKRKRTESSSSVLKSEPPSSLSGSLLPSPKSTSVYSGNMPSTSKITTGYVTQATGTPSSGQGSPVKITFTKGGGTTSQQSAPMNSAQKVIIVSSGGSSYTPTILQLAKGHLASRALSTMSSSVQSATTKQPVVLTTVAGQHTVMGTGRSGVHGTIVSAGKTYTTTTSTVDPRSASFPQNPAVLTSNTAMLASNTAMLASNAAVLASNPTLLASNPALLASNPALLASNQGMLATKQRPKTFTKQKIVKPFSIIGGSGGPQGGPGHSGITMTTPSPTAAGKKPTIHIKQESPGVKIITQTIGNTGKMVPKHPITIATTSGGSVVMVTCVPSSIVMSGKPIVTNAGSHGGTVRSIYGSGTRYVSAPTGIGGAKPPSCGSNVITVSPRALQSALKGSIPTTVVVTKAPGSGGHLSASHLGAGKANVIVVQKSQMLPKTVSIQRSLSSPEVQKHLLSGTSSLLTRPKISMVTTTTSLTTSTMSPTVRFPVPPSQIRGYPSGVTTATTMTMTPVVGGQMQGGSSKLPMTVGVISGPKGGQDVTSRAAQVVIRSKTSLSQSGQPIRRRSGSPASTASFLEFPSQLTPVEGERLARVTVQRRSASVSPTLLGQSSPGVLLEDSGLVARLSSKEHLGQVPMLFHTASARQPNREWIDYDGNPPEQSASSAIKALLEFRAQPQSAEAAKQRQVTVDLAHLSKVSVNQMTKSPTMASQVNTRTIPAQHITVKKGAITGPLPGPAVHPTLRRIPPTTTTPSVFTGSQTMMEPQFQKKQVSDIRRSTSITPFLQSATMEVEKALQEQNKVKQQSKGTELSSTLPQLTQTPPQVTQTIIKPQLTHPKQASNKPANIVTIEEEGVVSADVALSPAEVNSFIDQFERFLENEGLESEMEGSEKLAAFSRSQVARGRAELGAKVGKSLQVPKPTPGDVDPRRGGHNAGSAPVSGVRVGVLSSSAGSSGGNLTWKENYAQQVQQAAQKALVLQSRPTVKPLATGSVSTQKPSTLSESAVTVDTDVKHSQLTTLHEMLSQGKGAVVESIHVVTAGQTKPAASTVVDSSRYQAKPLTSAVVESTRYQVKPVTSAVVESTRYHVKPVTSAVVESTRHQAKPVASAVVESVRLPTKPAATVVVESNKYQVVKPATSVVVESSRFDASQMKMEDFTSQRLQDDFDVSMTKQDDIPSSGSSPTSSQKSPARSEGVEVSLSGSQSEESLDASLDAQGVRSSKRKRKAPVPIDEDIGPMCMPSWARAALNLLHRVMRFRGANRSKGDLNAASWFTRPVDPSEAPGYMQLIKTPMDFSTIKKKLENNQYNDLSEFHNDMMLVRGNCHLYNPPGHEARKDCEEVFQFYTAEYGKVLDRMQKALQFNTPKSPKKNKPESPPLLAPVSPTKPSTSTT